MENVSRSRKVKYRRSNSFSISKTNHLIDDEMIIFSITNGINTVVKLYVIIYNILHTKFFTREL